MIQDLAGHAIDRSRLDCDVLIIGGGTVGLVMADRLARAGRRTIVLESGGLSQPQETHPLNAVVQLGSTYQGAMDGRFRCLGGSSTRWGGALLPFQAADLEEAEHAWPTPIDALLAYRKDVETLFDLPSGSYAPSDPALPGFQARLAKWPAFGRRNVASLLHAPLHDPAGPEVWLNAIAVEFSMAADGRLAGVTARSPDGRTLEVSAPEVVIAAGAIESTRLLLLIDRLQDNRIFAPDDVLGRYFHDHLSVRTGDLRVHDKAALNLLAGFRFEGRGMRNLRFELSETSALRYRLPPSFTHIAFRDTAAGGLDALRDIFRRLQQRKPPSIQALVQLAASAPWLTRAVWWRFVEKRLLYPERADIELHTVIEQRARPENRISLATDAVDSFGLPLAAIDWRVHADDLTAVSQTADAFETAWKDSPMARLATIERRATSETEADLSSSGGIYHPGGSTRLGATARDGVLDADFRTHRIPNLSVLATSAFPTGGGANPTMMLLMAGLRSADAIAARR